MRGYFLNNLVNFKTRPAWHALFLASCGLFLAIFAAGAYCRLTLPGEPILVHFSALGNVFAARGQVTDAVESYSELLEIRPMPEVEFNLANTLAASGKTGQAINHYLRAIQLNPVYAQAHYNLANLLAAQGDYQEAFSHYQRATEIDDNYLDAWLNWAIWEFRAGRSQEAAAKLAKVLERDPNRSEASLTLALIHLRNRQYRDARRVLEEGLRRSPNHWNLADSLAWTLATAPEADLRDGPRAVQIAESVQAAAPANPQYLDTLAAAYAESGRFSDAVRTIDAALQLTHQSNPSAADALGRRRDLYLRKKAYREPR